MITYFIRTSSLDILLLYKNTARYSASITGVLPPLVSRFSVESVIDIATHFYRSFLHARSTVVCITSAPARAPRSMASETRSWFTAVRVLPVAECLLRASAFGFVQLSAMEEYQFCGGIVSGTRAAPFTIPENRRETRGSEPRKRLIWFTAESQSERGS